MIVDAVENVGEVSLGIDAVELRGLNDCHRAGECLGTGVGPCEEPVLATYSNWAQGALGRIVVDCDATIGQKQAEGFLTAQAIAKGFCQIAFPWNSLELLF